MAQSLELCFHTQSFITKAKLCAATMGRLHQKCRCNHVFHEHRAPERHIATQSFRGGKFWHRALFFAQSIAFVHRALLLYTELFFEEGITDVTQSSAYKRAVYKISVHRALLIYTELHNPGRALCCNYASIPLQTPVQSGISGAQSSG